MPGNSILRQGRLAIALLALSAPLAYGQSLFSEPDPSFQGRVMITSGVVLPGNEVTVAGRNFKPGQTVTLRSQGKALNTNGPLVADDKGEFEFKYTLPKDAVAANHPVVLEAANPPFASVINVKVSPDVPLSGQDKFATASQKLSAGVYQSAYSAKTGKLFVTAAVGRPPVKSSTLSKVDAQTLKVEAEATPPVAKGRDDGHLVAVYGVAVDDAHGHVWTTNTRDGAVSVYRQSDLSLVKQFDNGVAGHARDVVVHEQRNKAYVSTPGTAHVVVFDTAKQQHLTNIELKSEVRGATPSPMSLAIDSKGGKVYLVASGSDEVFVIDTNTDTVEKVLSVKGIRSASGVAIDAAKQRVWVTAQGSDNVSIVDIASGDTIKTVQVGAGALNVQFDPVKRLAYTANRGAGTVTVLDENGTIVANLDGGSFPNHVSVDGKGNVYALNKARGAKDETGDRITRLTPKQ